jgi:hypothetical protein
MKYRALDENGDYTFGRRIFHTGREAVAQAIVTRLYLLYGEWWENLEDGLPLFEEILGAYGGNQARQIVDIVIGDRIRGTTDVTELLDYSSTFNTQTRMYEATCSVNTLYGIAYLTMSDNPRRVEVTY